MNGRLFDGLLWIFCWFFMDKAFLGSTIDRQPYDGVALIDVFPIFFGHIKMKLILLREFRVFLKTLDFFFLKFSFELQIKLITFWITKTPQHTDHNREDPLMVFFGKKVV